MADEKKTSAQLAIEMTLQIRADRATRAAHQPGEVIGGDSEHWNYVHVPADPMQKDRLEAKLGRRGYVRCSDGETMAGMHSGQVWKIPRAIHREMMADRHKRIMARRT